MSLSSDARIFTGFTVAGSFYPYVVVLDATQAYAPALDVQATQNLGTANVQVRWNAPLEGDYEVQGYNVYRGQTKVNTTLVPPADRNTFLDADVPVNSRHWYSVEAVYADGVAPKSDSVSIYVIDPDGCLPVQNIYSNVVYNRTVQLDWDLPSSETPMSKGVIKTEDAYPAGFFQPGVNTLSAAVKVDDYIYTTTIGGEFTIYDANTHKALKSIEIQGLTAAYDMTYHDGIFWVACNSDQILELARDVKDPLDVSLSRYWSARITNVTHIAYVENKDESFNEGKDYLALGDYESVLFYPVTARRPEQSLPGSGTGFDNLIIGGSEYHNGKLYITDQSGANGCDLVTFDMATKEEIHRQNLFENAQIVEYAGGSVSYPLGLTKTTLSDGTVVLECLMQSNIGANFVVNLEIETSSSVLGYRVYRNNKPVSDTLRFRHFEEELFEEGTYVYTIEYLDQKGCSINSSVVDVSSTVVITPVGECDPPVALKAYESNRIAVLTWDDKDISGLVSFNVYRNGSLISEPRFLDLKFYDTEAKMNEKYMYVVEAFYSNSCVASDTVEITLNGQGVAEAPAAVNVDGILHDAEDGKFDVKASWELPFFEEPMPYGYCKHPAYAYSIGDVSEVYCAIGWDADDMAKFDDLYLVGVEFMLGTTQVQNIRTLIYVDDILVHVQPFDGRFSA
ncbi:MAG: fibronectin type III domain-containing protein, partial [Bacteroidales bacterium]|nr:fibronectin type III domain-containing protein [Bacteroidales bacterium]